MSLRRQNIAIERSDGRRGQSDNGRLAATFILTCRTRGNPRHRKSRLFVTEEQQRDILFNAARFLRLDESSQ
jgi:hypothetical protein